MGAAAASNGASVEANSPGGSTVDSLAQSNEDDRLTMLRDELFEYDASEVPLARLQNSKEQRSSEFVPRPESVGNLFATPSDDFSYNPVLANAVGLQDSVPVSASLMASGERGGGESASLLSAGAAAIASVGVGSSGSAGVTPLEASSSAGVTAGSATIIASRDVAQALHFDISSLTLGDSEGASFTAKVMLPRLALLNKVREAVGRQLKRESAAQLAQQQAVRWQMQAEGPVLPPASKLGLNMLVQTMVLLLKSAQKSDPAVVQEVLGMAASLLRDAPPLSLREGLGANSDVERGLNPVLAYLRELLQPKPVSAAAAPSVAASTSASSLVHLSLSHVPPHNPSSRAHQVSGALAPSTGASSGGSSSGKELSQALGVLLGLALVRGSLSDLLSLLDILLKRASQVASDETASEETFDIQAQLHCLGRFTDQQLVAYVAATGQLPSGSSRDRLVSLRSVVNGKALTAAADLTVSFTTSSNDAAQRFILQQQRNLQGAPAWNLAPPPLPGLESSGQRDTCFVSLRSVHDTYVSAKLDGSIGLVAGRLSSPDGVGSSEIFRLVQVPEDSTGVLSSGSLASSTPVALMTSRHMFLSVDAGKLVQTSFLTSSACFLLMAPSDIEADTSAASDADEAVADADADAVVEATDEDAPLESDDDGGIGTAPSLLFVMPSSSPSNSGVPPMCCYSLSGSASASSTSGASTPRPTESTREEKSTSGSGSTRDLTAAVSAHQLPTSGSAADLSHGAADSSSAAATQGRAELNELDNATNALLTAIRAPFLSSALLKHLGGTHGLLRSYHSEQEPSALSQIPVAALLGRPAEAGSPLAGGSQGYLSGSTPLPYTRAASTTGGALSLNDSAGGPSVSCSVAALFVLTQLELLTRTVLGCPRSGLDVDVAESQTEAKTEPAPILNKALCVDVRQQTFSQVTALLSFCSQRYLEAVTGNAAATASLASHRVSVTHGHVSLTSPQYALAFWGHAVQALLRVLRAHVTQVRRTKLTPEAIGVPAADISALRKLVFSLAEMAMAGDDPASGASRPAPASAMSRPNTASAMQSPVASALPSRPITIRLGGRSVHSTTVATGQSHAQSPTPGSPSPAPISSELDVATRVKREAASVLSSGFEFFLPSSVQQFKYLAVILDRYVAHLDWLQAHPVSTSSVASRAAGEPKVSDDGAGTKSSSLSRPDLAPPKPVLRRARSVEGGVPNSPFVLAPRSMPVALDSDGGGVEEDTRPPSALSPEELQLLMFLLARYDTLAAVVQLFEQLCAKDVAAENIMVFQRVIRSLCAACVFCGKTSLYSSATTLGADAGSNRDGEAAENPLLHGSAAIAVDKRLFPSCSRVLARVQQYLLYACGDLTAPAADATSSKPSGVAAAQGGKGWSTLGAATLHPLLLIFCEEVLTACMRTIKDASVIAKSAPLTLTVLGRLSDHFLYRGLLGEIGRPLVAALCLLPASSAIAPGAGGDTIVSGSVLAQQHLGYVAVLTPLCSQLLPTVTRLVRSMDQFILTVRKQCRGIETSDGHKLSSLTVPVERVRVVQSRHPYHGKIDSQDTVCIKGAASLSVVFDAAKCSTASSRDYVQLLRGSGSSATACTDKLWGASVPQTDLPSGRLRGGVTKTRWPKDPVTVAGDTVTVQFHTDSHASDWGFKLTVSATVQVKPLSWLKDLTRTGVWLSGALAKTVLGAEEADSFRPAAISAAAPPAAATPPAAAAGAGAGAGNSNGTPLPPAPVLSIAIPRLPSGAVLPAFPTLSLVPVLSTVAGSIAAHACSDIALITAEALPSVKRWLRSPLLRGGLQSSRSSGGIPTISASLLQGYLNGKWRLEAALQDKIVSKGLPGPIQTGDAVLSGGAGKRPVPVTHSRSLSVLAAADTAAAELASQHTVTSSSSAIAANADTPSAVSEDDLLHALWALDATALDEYERDERAAREERSMRSPSYKARNVLASPGGITPGRPKGSPRISLRQQSGEEVTTFLGGAASPVAGGSICVELFKSPAVSPQAMHAAQSLVSALETQLKDKHVVQKSIARVASRCRNLMFAALLKHTRKAVLAARLVQLLVSGAASDADVAPSAAGGVSTAPMMLDPLGGANAVIKSPGMTASSQTEVLELYNRVANVWRKACDIKVEVRTLKAQSGDLLSFCRELCVRCSFLLELAVSDAIPSPVPPPTPHAGSFTPTSATGTPSAAATTSGKSGPVFVFGATSTASEATSGADTVGPLPLPSGLPAGLPPRAPLLSRVKSKWTPQKQMSKVLTGTMQALRKIREYTRIRTRLARAGQTSHMDPELIAIQETITFLTCSKGEVHVEALWQGLVAQRSRAVRRLLGLKAFHDLARSLRSQSLLPHLLRHLASAFGASASEVELAALSAGKASSSTASASSGKNKPAQRPAGSSSAAGSNADDSSTQATATGLKSSDDDTARGKSHFLARLGAAGPDLQTALSSSYFALVSNLISRKKPLDGLSQLYLLDVCNIEFVPSDLAFLQRINVVPYLAPLLAFPGNNPALLNDGFGKAELLEHASARIQPWNLRYGAWSLFRLVTYVASQWATCNSWNNVNAPEELQLQQSIFRTLCDHMQLLLAMRDQERARIWGVTAATASPSNDPSALADGSSAVAEDRLWICSRCTYLNDQSATNCAVCDTSTAQSAATMRLLDPKLGTQSDTEKWERPTAAADTRQFTYASDFDTNGIMYWLGTKGGTQPWVNPMDLGAVKVTSSSLKSDSQPLSAVVGRTAVRCVTESNEDSWMAIDLLDKHVQPTHYTLRHYISYDTEALRSWRLEGSNDQGKTWVTIRAHSNDAALKTMGGSHTWDLPNVSDRYRMFRVLMTGPNSNSNNYLACSGFEMYGTLFLSDGASEAAPFQFMHDLGCKWSDVSVVTAPDVEVPPVVASTSAAANPLAVRPPARPDTDIADTDLVDGKLAAVSSSTPAAAASVIGKVDTGRSRCSSTATVLNGKVFLCGGLGAENEVLDSVVALEAAKVSPPAPTVSTDSDSKDAAGAKPDAASSVAVQSSVSLQTFCRMPTALHSHAAAAMLLPVDVLEAVFDKAASSAAGAKAVPTVTLPHATPPPVLARPTSIPSDSVVPASARPRLIGCIAVYGGRTHNSKKPLDSLWLLDTIQNRWVEVPVDLQAPRPPAFANGCMVALREWLIVHPGAGETDQPLAADMWAISLHHLVWRKVECKGFAVPSCMNASLVVHNNNLWRFGGQAGGLSAAKLDGLFQFRLSPLPDSAKPGSATAAAALSGEWVKHDLRQAPSARSGHAVAVSGPYMFVYGGIDTKSQKLGDVHVLDVEQLQWHALDAATSVAKSAPAARTNAVIAVMQRALYLIGGVTAQGVAKTVHRLLVHSPRPGASDVWATREANAHLSDASVQWWLHERNDVGLRGLPQLVTATTPRRPVLAEVNLYINQLLWTLLRCCQASVVRDTLAQSEWSEMLLNLAQDDLAVMSVPAQSTSGKSRLSQLLALRICRLVVPRIHPAALQSPLRSALTGAVPPAAEGEVALDFLGQVLDRIGDAVMDTNVSALLPSRRASRAQPGSQAVATARLSLGAGSDLAPEWLSLFRSLLQPSVVVLPSSNNVSSPHVGSGVPSVSRTASMQPLPPNTMGPPAAVNASNTPAVGRVVSLNRRSSYAGPFMHVAEDVSPRVRPTAVSSAQAGVPVTSLRQDSLTGAAGSGVAAADRTAGTPGGRSRSNSASSAGSLDPTSAALGLGASFTAGFANSFNQQTLMVAEAWQAWSRLANQALQACMAPEAVDQVLSSLRQQSSSAATGVSSAQAQAAIATSSASGYSITLSSNPYVSPPRSSTGDTTTSPGLVMDGSFAGRLRRLLAGLAVLGGAVHNLREGGRAVVAVDDEKIEGTIVKLVRQQPSGGSMLSAVKAKTSVHIHLDTGEDVVVEDLTRITATYDVSVPYLGLEQKQLLIASLARCVFTSGVEVVAGPVHDHFDQSGGASSSKPDAALNSVQSDSKDAAADALITLPSLAPSLALFEIRRRAMKALLVLARDPSFLDLIERHTAAGAISAGNASGTSSAASLPWTIARHAVTCLERFSVDKCIVPLGVTECTVENLEARLLAIEAALTAQRQSPDAVGAGAAQASKHVCKYTADFDTNGLMYWLGTLFGQQAWVNPVELGLVAVSCNHLKTDSDCAPISAAVGRSTVRVVSEDADDAFFEFELKTCEIRPSHYTLRHYSSWDNECLRSWDLRAQSSDSDDWVTLKKHSNDTSLNGKGSTHTWALEPLPNTASVRYFRRFRVCITGPNSNHHHFLPMSGFEIYGEVTVLDAAAILTRAGSSSANASIASSAVPAVPVTPVSNANRQTQAATTSDATSSSAAATDSAAAAAVGAGSLKSSRRQQKRLDPRMLIVPGQVVSFGNPSVGLLGRDPPAPVPVISSAGTPAASLPGVIPLSAFGGVKVACLSVFSTHVIACTENYKCYTWGAGADGRLGHGDYADRKLPTIVNGLSAERITMVAAGNAFSLALTDRGQVFAWGKGSEGQLGLGTVSESKIPARVGKALDGVRVTTIGVGAFHSLAVSDSGELFTWGRNTRGQLATSSTVNQLSPYKVDADKLPSQRFVHVLGGWDHSMGITAKGELYTWGNGYEGTRPTTGHGHMENVLLPKMVAALAGHVVVQAACGWDHCMCITSQGQLYTWGSNPHGALGLNHMDPVKVPTRVQFGGLESERVVSVAGGQNHTVAVTDKGEVWAWGNSGPQLGAGSPSQRSVPAKIQLVLPGSSTPVTAELAGMMFSTVHCGDKVTFLRQSPFARKLPSTPLLAYGHHSMDAGLVTAIGSQDPLPPYPWAAWLTGDVDRSFQGFTLSGRSTVPASARFEDPALLTSLDTPGWRFHAGKDSPGGDITQVMAAIDDVEALVGAANSTAKCVAFTTSGWLKSAVKAETDWLSMLGGSSSGKRLRSQGIFVRRDDHKYLPLKLVSNDGGDQGSTYAVEKMFIDDTSMYCSRDKRNINVLVELKDNTSDSHSTMWPTAVTVRQATNCTHPIQIGAVFVLDSPDQVAATVDYNSMNAAEYSKYCAEKYANVAPADLPATHPVCFFDNNNQADRSFPVNRFRGGRYLLLKLIASNQDRTTPENIDVKFIGVYGHVGSLPAYMQQDQARIEAEQKAQLAAQEAAGRQGKLVNFVPTSSSTSAVIRSAPSLTLSADGQSVVLSASSQLVADLHWDDKRAVAAAGDVALSAAPISAAVASPVVGSTTHRPHGLTVGFKLKRVSAPSGGSAAAVPLRLLALLSPASASSAAGSSPRGQPLLVIESDATLNQCSVFIGDAVAPTGSAAVPSPSTLAQASLIGSFSLDPVDAPTMSWHHLAVVVHTPTAVISELDGDIAHAVGGGNADMSETGNAPEPAPSVSLFLDGECVLTRTFDTAPPAILTQWSALQQAITSGACRLVMGPQAGLAVRDLGVWWQPLAQRFVERVCDGGIGFAADDNSFDRRIGLDVCHYSLQAESPAPVLLRSSEVKLLGTGSPSGAQFVPVDPTVRADEQADKPGASSLGASSSLAAMPSVSSVTSATTAIALRCLCLKGGAYLQLSRGVSLSDPAVPVSDYTVIMDFMVPHLPSSSRSALKSKRQSSDGAGQSDAPVSADASAALAVRSTSASGSGSGTANPTADNNNNNAARVSSARAAFTVLCANAAGSGAAPLVTMSSRGILALLGKTDKRRVHIHAGRWHRLVVDVRLSAKQASMYLDAELVTRLTADDRLIANGVFALSQELTVAGPAGLVLSTSKPAATAAAASGDAAAKVCADSSALPSGVLLRAVQIRCATALIKLTDLKDVAVPSAELSAVSPLDALVHRKSLLRMGYPSVWVDKALHACALHREVACDWIMRRRPLLQVQDKLTEHRDTAVTLSQMGYPLHLCLQALAATGTAAAALLANAPADRITRPAAADSAPAAPVLARQSSYDAANKVNASSSQALLARFTPAVTWLLDRVNSSLPLADAISVSGAGSDADSTASGPPGLNRSRALRVDRGDGKNPAFAVLESPAELNDAEPLSRGTTASVGSSSTGGTATAGTTAASAGAASSGSGPGAARSRVHDVDFVSALALSAASSAAAPPASPAPAAAASGIPLAPPVAGSDASSSAAPKTVHHRVSKAEQISSLLVERAHVERALAVMYARRCMLSILSHRLPPLQAPSVSSAADASTTVPPYPLFAVCTPAGVVPGVAAPRDAVLAELARFLPRLLRLLEFTGSSEILSGVRTVLMSYLHNEAVAVHLAQSTIGQGAGSTSALAVTVPVSLSLQQSGGFAAMSVATIASQLRIPYHRFCELAPVSRILLEFVLAHLLLLVKTGDVADATSEQAAVEAVSPAFLLWILNTFLEVSRFKPSGAVDHTGGSSGARSTGVERKEREQKEPLPSMLRTASTSWVSSAPASSSGTRSDSTADTSGSAVSAIGRWLFAPEMVNLLFEAVAVVKGDERLAFVRLLGTLVSMQVLFDTRKAIMLQDLMIRTHAAQTSSGAFTAFMQALVELHLALNDRQAQAAAAPKQLTDLSVNAGHPGASSVLANASSTASVPGSALAGSGLQLGGQFGQSPPISLLLPGGPGSASLHSPMFDPAVSITAGQGMQPALLPNPASAAAAADAKVGTVAADQKLASDPRRTRTGVSDSTRSDTSSAYTDADASDDSESASADAAEPSVEFVYESNMDENGALYWLGTRGGTEPWRNPSDRGLVQVSMSSVNATSLPSSAIVGRESARCVTQDNENSWFIVDLKGRRIQPTAYTLRHYSSYDVEALRNWRFEGSEDGTTWHVIRVHDNDAALNKAGQSNTWTLTCSEEYSLFRVFMFGKNSNSNWYLACCGFELYGHMIPLPEDMPPSQAADQGTDDDDAANDSESVTGSEATDATGAGADTDVDTAPLWWDTAAASSVEFSGPDIAKPSIVTVANNPGQGWVCCKSVQSFSAGKHSLTFRVINSAATSNSWKIVLGMVPPTFGPTSDYKCVGGAAGGWGYVAATGKKYAKNHGIQESSYGASYSTGDEIKMVMELDPAGSATGTLECFKNGVSQGIMASNLRGPVHAAMCATASGTSLELISGDPAIPSTAAPDSAQSTPSKPSRRVSKLASGSAAAAGGKGHAKKKKKRSAEPPSASASSTLPLPPWFQAVVLTYSCMKALLHRKPLPLQFARDCWKLFSALPSEKELRTARSEDKYSDVAPAPEYREAEQLAADIIPQPLSHKDVSSGLHEFYHMSRVFSLAADLQLVQCVDRFADKTAKSAEALSPAEFEPAPKDLLYFQELETIPPRERSLRFLVMREFNKRVALLLPLVDFSLPPQRSTLTDYVRAMRGLVFFSVKRTPWERALSATTVPSTSVPVTVDRLKANKLVEEKKTDLRGRRSFFSQLFRQLHDRPASVFRIGSNERAFKVTTVGEFADDHGGPYRATLESACSELKSEVLPLFIPCPNAREDIGMNRDKWVPRPSATRPLYLTMYEFLGKLMGLAIRTKNILNLNLPSIVWKPLVGDAVTEEDVSSIDVLSFKILEEIKKMEVVDDPQTFNDYSDLTFTIIGSDQKTYELVPGGTTKKVTWENRHDFVAALKRFRVDEFSAQCQAIRRGLATVVPYRLLSLFTWRQLELLVCGRTEFDVDLLFANTVYDGCSASDDHIVNFWKMMRERFDDEARCSFLSFVWGRSRLPTSSTGFDRPFKITRMYKGDSNADKYLPISHTCFFSVELPKYSTLDIMHDKVLYAITHCVAIDADDTSAARAAAMRTATPDDDSDDDDDHDDS